MKILNSVLLITLLFSVTASSQDISDNALGLRLGDSDGFGAEISYQRLLSRYHRLELNLGWRDSREFDAIKVSGLYQWVRHIDGNFNWYYGAGAGLGSASFEPVPGNGTTEPFTPDGGFFAFIAGTVGVEYNFDIPLLLSLDIRPELGLIGYNDFSDNFDFDIALGIRYQF
ncbi:hypothetical protein [uncultured Eudoraea sp.]|uniref:hypothetical protein n=1 Tax=uncultured Eudoraea sp. TaxID=1035614 RepID=UPI0026247259|nr:hypothetical protein [uncultured Eudoraea sp.]